MPFMDTVPQHAIIQFSELMHIRAQQVKARLRPYVEIRPMDGRFMAYDGFGTVEATEVFGRYQPVTFSDIEHFRRRISRRKFTVTLPIDATDVEAQLTDPQSTYADACVRAMERVFDRVVVDAMFATVFAGEDFEKTITSSADGVISVDATAGTTYEKLLEIHKNFINNEVGNDMPVKFCMGITGGEHSDLMSELELTSGDYSRQYVVDGGQIQRAVGIDLIKYGTPTTNPAVSGGALPILPEVSGQRTTFCMTEKAMCVGLSRAWKIKIQDRTDLVDTTQVQITGVLGAVRTEGKLIQQVTTTV